jgi:hypothetical protein
MTQRMFRPFVSNSSPRGFTVCHSERREESVTDSVNPSTSLAGTSNGHTPPYVPELAISMKEIILAIIAALLVEAAKSCVNLAWCAWKNRRPRQTGT